MLKRYFNQALTAISTSPLDTLGDLRLENGVWYKYVEIRNATATVAGVAGDPVGYFAGTGVVNSRVVLDLTDADNPPIPAGLLQGTVAGVHSPPTSYYGWIQLTGPHAVPTAVSSGAAGCPVKLTTTDKTLAKVSEVDSTGAYQSVCGISIDASGANNQIICNFPR